MLKVLKSGHSKCDNMNQTQRDRFEFRETTWNGPLNLNHAIVFWIVRFHGINSNKQSKEFSSALEWTLWYQTSFKWSFCAACKSNKGGRTGQNQGTFMKIFINHRILSALRYILDISGKVFCHYNFKVKKGGPIPVMKIPAYIKKSRF